MSDTAIADRVAALPQPAEVTAFHRIARVTHELDRLGGFCARVLDIPLVEGP